VSSVNVRRRSVPERRAGKGVPRLVVVDELADLLRGPQRLQDGGPHPLGDAREAAIEVLPGKEIHVVAQRGNERRTGGFRIGGIDEQTTARVVRKRRVRRIPALDQLEVELQVLDDWPREQGDEVGVPRQAGFDTGERSGRDGRPADVVQPLEDEDAPASPGEVGGGRQPVVAGADDDVVVGRGATHRDDPARGRQP
jgi:hypothetical protein